MISLAVEDVNLSAGKIVINAGKNQKYREVPLFPSVRLAVEKYLPFRLMLVEKGNRNTHALFVNQYGYPFTEDGGHNAIDRIAKLAGIRFSPHRARRFYGRHLWDKGMKPELIQQILGHTDVGTTMIYIQPDIDDAFEVVRKEVKKLDFRDALMRGRIGLERMSERNLVYMVCSVRDLDPSRGIESPLCLA